MKKFDLKRNIVPIIGLILLIIALSVLSIMDFGVLSNKEVVKIHIDENEKYNGGNTLYANLYKGDSPYVVMLLGGFSSDQQMMLPLAKMMNDSGLSVMTLDYSGHSKSSGVIGFDNATNGQIPREIGYAIDSVKKELNISEDKIILAGHSMGGRAIIEMLSQDTDNDYAGLILIAPQINYDFNVQSSMFTGVTDSQVEPWASLGKEQITQAPIYLIGSHADDIVSTQSINEIYNRLSLNGTKTNTELDMVKTSLHSYEVYSQGVAEYVSCALSVITGEDVGGENLITLRVVMWFVGAIAMFMLFYSLGKAKEKEPQLGGLELISFNKFIKRKLLYWLPALLVCLVVMSLSVIAPIGAPAMSLSFIGFIAGYGIILIFVYKREKMKGVTGVLKPFTSDKTSLEKSNIFKAIAVFVLGGGALMGILYSGFYSPYPLNYRLVWLIIYTAIMSLHFYISSNEENMLNLANISFMKKVLYNIIQYVPVLVMSVLYLLMKSYSGLIGTIQNLIVLYIAIGIGNCVVKYTHRRWLGAITTAFLFQSALLTATSLIAIF